VKGTNTAAQRQNIYPQCNKKSPGGESSRGLKEQKLCDLLRQIMLPVK